jgi:hypothetical protein
MPNALWAGANDLGTRWTEIVRQVQQVRFVPQAADEKRPRLDEIKA